MLRQSAIIGIEVLVIPLVRAMIRMLLLVVVPVVVGKHFDAVLTLIIHIRGKVETERHDSVLAHAKTMAVEPHGSTMTRSLKLDKHLLPLRRLWQAERLDIAHGIIWQLVNRHLIGIVLVEGTRQRCGVSLSLVSVVPVTIEIVFCALGTKVQSEH